MKNIPYIAVIVLLIIILLQQNCANKASRTRIIEAAHDTIKVHRDRHNNEIVEMKASELGYKDQIKLLKHANDSISIQLREAITRHPRRPAGAVSTETETEIIVVTDTDTLWMSDTMVINDTVFLFPTYKTAYANQHIKFNVTASKDTVVNDITVYNKMDVVWSKSRKGWEVQVVNRNPYTTTKEAKSWASPKQNPKRFGIGVHAGYGMCILNNTVKLAPQAGVSLHYSIINF